MIALSRLHITLILGFAVLSGLIVLSIQGVSLSQDGLQIYLAPFGTVVGVLVGLIWILEHVAWSWRILHGWLVKRPDLRGTWRVDLQSSWINPETGTRIAPITCYMGVQQTLSTLQMHLMTPESESWFIADQIRPSPNGVGYQIVGVYSNTPDLFLRGVRSERHQGALVLDTHGPSHRPTSLTGDYWTDRKTSGTMVLRDAVPHLHTRYEDADGAFCPPTAATPVPST